MASLLFRELRFYLTRTLSAEAKAELAQLVEQNGGEVAASPAGATQIVDCERLDARHPEWISPEFITDSVAFRALQDPATYSGSIFTTQQSGRTSKRRGRMKYTLEEDARMLHFAKLRGWKAMDAVPESAWRLAEADNVTRHSAQSMHEHFRKQLQRKTPMEQRSLMAKAAAMTRAMLLEQEEVEEPPPSTDAATLEWTTLTRSQAARRTPDAAAAPDYSTVESRREEVEEEKFSARDRRMRSRKPTSPLRISQRRQRSEGPAFEESQSSGETMMSPIPASVSQTLTATPTTPTVSAAPATPATSEAPATQSTPVASASPAHPSTEGSRSMGKRQQKRKRSTPSSVATNSQEASPSRSEIVDSDAESVGSKTGGANGIFFRSVWTDLIGDSSKRRMLQRFFEPPSAPIPPVQARSAQSVVSDPSGMGNPTTTPVGEGDGENSEERQQSRTVQVEQATDEETDKIICQLQINTQHDMPAVVHALYYCSGDPEMAEAFLKGASPSEMWSPGDDLLLVNLVAEEGTNRATVGAAVTRGDFAVMQVSRDTDAIFKRVQFLR